MPLRLGIEIACRAAHQVSLADEEGRFIWTGRRFHTTPQDLARLWSMLPDGTDPAEVLVVMEPTRNAWAPLAPGSGAAAPVWCWFHRNARRICQTVAFSTSTPPARTRLRPPATPTRRSSPSGSDSSRPAGKYGRDRAERASRGCRRASPSAAQPAASAERPARRGRRLAA